MYLPTWLWYLNGWSLNERNLQWSQHHLSYGQYKDYFYQILRLLDNTRCGYHGWNVGNKVTLFHPRIPWVHVHFNTWLCCCIITVLRSNHFLEGCMAHISYRCSYDKVSCLSPATLLRNKNRNFSEDDQPWGNYTLLMTSLPLQRYKTTTRKCCAFFPGNCSKPRSLRSFSQQAEWLLSLVIRIDMEELGSSLGSFVWP